MLTARVEVRGGIGITYRQWGTADTPALVVAHGLPDGAFAFARLAEELQDVRRVLAFDLPAFGGSDRAPRGFEHTLDRYGAVFDGFVEALNLEAFDLCVHDVAGGYALPHAAKRLEQLTGLVLLNTQAFAGWRWHSVARRYRRPVLGRLMTLRPPRRQFERLLRPAFAQDPPRWYLDQLWDVWRRPDARRAVMSFYRSGEPEMWEPAERALAVLRGVPGVVVWGAADPFIHPPAADRHADALGVELVRLDDAGHFPHVERTHEVAAAVRRVLG